MADTNLLVLAREYKKLREEVKKVLSMPKGDKGDQGEKGEKGDTGDAGPQGFPGRDGKDGINGYDGKDGRDGVDGKDGKDGLDGVGVQNAYIDFDNSLVIVLSDGREVNAGFLSQETKDNVVATFKQGAATINELLPPQTGNANKFLKTDGTNVSWDTLDGSDIDLASPPVIGNTTPNAATFTTLTATGQTSLGGATGSESLRVTSNPSATSWVEISGSAGGIPNIKAEAVGASAELRLSSKSGSNVSIWTNNVAQRQFQVSHTASAVNYVQVTGAATNNRPTASSQGSDTDIGFNIVTKGSGTHNFASDANIGTSQFQVTRTQASAVNYLTATGAATNFFPRLFAAGSDTNISMAFQSKGTGGISLSTGSTGTNLVNGTSVTAITRTATGSGYTSLPSVAISAPTTAGGVQATVDARLTLATTPTITSGGSGYTAGDVLTLSGGASTTAATLTVSTVSGGVITAVSVSQFGVYTVLPSNPISVTGGTGSGATFTATWAVSSIFVITNAGSGYVEQPTVTFSGGGGSGAAAYATVGSNVPVKGLGNSVDFYVPEGIGFRVSGASSSGGAYWMSFAGSTTPIMRAVGSASGILETGSAVPIQFRTNGATSGVEQLRVAHTASAVNFVQVTGAATGSGPVISAQGSDTNVGLAFRSKGSGFISFGQDSTNQFEIIRTASAVNRLRVTGSTAGNAPIMASEGTDTNIGLNLTTKGTGAVNLNTGSGTSFQAADLGAATTDFIQTLGASGSAYLGVAGASANVNMFVSSKGTGSLAFYTNGAGNTQQFRVTHTASAVNFVQVTGAATGGSTVISSQGSDANIQLQLQSKGTGILRLATGSGLQAYVTDTGSPVNQLVFTGAAAGGRPTISVAGTDTNIDLALTPKGTGNVRFGTYTAGALSIAGYIEIKDAGGTVRRLAVVA